MNNNIRFQFSNNMFYSFTYTLMGITYSTGVLFKTPIAENEFSRFIPEIKRALVWLDKNAAMLPNQIKTYLSENEIAIFDKTHLVSFALTFEKQNSELNMNLAYGDDGVYLTVIIVNNAILSVKINT